ncbi:MAG: hypothetical protein JW839_04170 [Candidatus Lokiarchaeota archaeon]|nr:hypothetical protein [Candidatus Lokiarchaeota archaeon]
MKEDELRNEKYVILRDSGVRVRFTSKDRVTFKCEVCGQLGPPKTYNGPKLPYKCAICGKVLCINCYSNGFCPDHEALVTDNEKHTLATLERKRLRLILAMIPYCIGVSTFLAIVFLLGDEILVYFFPVILIVPIVIICILARKIENKLKYMFKRS